MRLHIQVVGRLEARQHPAMSGRGLGSEILHWWSPSAAMTSVSRTCLRCQPPAATHGSYHRPPPAGAFVAALRPFQPFPNPGWWPACRCQGRTCEFRSGRRQWPPSPTPATLSRAAGQDACLRLLGNCANRDSESAMGRRLSPTSSGALGASSHEIIPDNVSRSSTRKREPPPVPFSASQ